MGDLDFTIDIHHGGKFHDVGDGLQYLGGSVLNDLHFEIDEWFLQEIVSELQKLGYRGYAKIWFCAPECPLNTGLRALMSDGDAMKMGRLLVSQPVKHYSVYVVDECKEGNGVEITSNDEDYIPSKEDYIGSGDGLVEVEVEGESAPSSEEDMFDDSADDGEHEDYFGFDVEDDNEGATSNAFSGFNGPLNGQHNEQGDGGEAGGGDVSGVDADSDGGNSGDEISDGYETEEIDSYEGDSDDMVKKNRYPKYNEAEMSKDYRFQVGLEFKSIAEFREAIKEHALLNGRDIKYKKNDRVRCRVGCKGRKGKCKWLCFASKVGGDDCVRIKTLKGRHTCGRNPDGKLASSSWVTKKVANHISRGKDMKLSTVIQCIQYKYMAKISVKKAYWARRKAGQEVYGRAILQYSKLRDYCAEILRANPGSSTRIQVDRPSLTHQPRFMRMYMCLDAVKQGFLVGCRPIIGVDGCHLKGDHGQQLLVAVGRDPNDNYQLLSHLHQLYKQINQLPKL